MNMIKIVILLSLFGVTGVSVANNYSNVEINGTRLTVQQVRILENQLGSRVYPGRYLYNANNQCWANLTTGQSNCNGGGSSSNTSRNGQAGMRASRTGSGEWDGQGNWSSYSEYGGSVGGTEDGCYYTANWSNC
jgi:hypothetical protein